MKPSTHRASLKLLGLIAALAHSACADAKLQEEVPSLDILQVLSAAATLEIGESVSVGALRLKNRMSTNVTGTVEWSSDDESIATVSYSEDAGAVVKAISAGRVQIRATHGKRTGTAEFVVTAGVASIELDKGLIELANGTSLPLGATLITTENEKRALDQATWGSSNVAIATVDDEGTVAGVGVGEAVITITREGISASQRIHVRDWTLESFDAEAPAGMTLPFGQSSAIRVTGSFSGGHTQDITGLFGLSAGEGDGTTAMDDESMEPLLTIEDAVVTAGAKEGAIEVTGAGLADSIVADQSFKIEFTVVDAPLTALGLVLPPVLSVGGDSALATITGTYGDGLEFSTTATLTADPEDLVAIDNAAATITALEAGSVTVTASVVLEDGDDDPATGPTVEASQDVEVVEDGVSALSLALASPDEDAQISVDESTALTVAATFGSSDAVDVTDLAIWSSSDEAIAVVSNVSAGNVTGVGSGSATITASYRGTTADFAVEVSAP
jgi:uncharacterized protein YjdB